MTVVVCVKQFNCKSDNIHVHNSMYKLYTVCLLYSRTYCNVELHRVNSNLIATQMMHSCINIINCNFPVQHFYCPLYGKVNFEYLHSTKNNYNIVIRNSHSRTVWLKYSSFKCSRERLRLLTLMTLPSTESRRLGESPTPRRW